ncbi:hypothetical protein V3C99_018125 [Haemonchus contortus]
MAATAGAHAFRRLTLHNLYNQPNTRRKSSTVIAHPTTSAVTLSEQPAFSLPVYCYRKPPSRPPSRPPSGPPSTPCLLSRRNTAKSDVENIGRVKWDELRRNGDGALEGDVSAFIPAWKKTLKLLKILLPHVGLNILLLSYITMGAMMFIWLEADHELQNRKEKLQRIFSMYDKIINESSLMCSGTLLNYSQVSHSRLRPLLRILSRTHEYDDKFTESGQLWIDNEGDLTTRWSFAAAVLYALTVITSTGYDHVTPTTDPGRIFTVFFGLIGIPLMFITAADIGKFLSEIVIRTYGKLLQFWHFVSTIVELLQTNLCDGDVDSMDSL